MKTSSTKVDAVTTKMYKLKLKGKCYGCGGNHACGKAKCQAKHQSGISIVKGPLCWSLPE